MTPPQKFLGSETFAKTVSEFFGITLVVELFVFKLVHTSAFLGTTPDSTYGTGSPSGVTPDSALYDAGFFARITPES